LCWNFKHHPRIFNYWILQFQPHYPNSPKRIILPEYIQFWYINFNLCLHYFKKFNYTKRNSYVHNIGNLWQGLVLKNILIWIQDLIKLFKISISFVNSKVRGRENRPPRIARQIPNRKSSITCFYKYSTNGCIAESRSKPHKTNKIV